MFVTFAKKKKKKFWLRDKVACENSCQCAVPEKNPYPPHGRSSEIPRGRGILKVRSLEAKYEATLEFPGGRGGAKQKLSMEGVWIFSGTAQLLKRFKSVS